MSVSYVAYVADDVAAEVKSRRLAELFAAYRQGQAELNAQEVGRVHLALLDGRPRRDGQYRAVESLQGRTDSMKRVIIKEQKLPVSLGSLQQHWQMRSAAASSRQHWDLDNSVLQQQARLEQYMTEGCLGPVASAGVGDYVAVQVQQVVGHSTLICVPLAKTSISEFAAVFGSCTPGIQQIPAWLQQLMLLQGGCAFGDMGQQIAAHAGM